MRIDPSNFAKIVSPGAAKRLSLYASLLPTLVLWGCAASPNRWSSPESVGTTGRVMGGQQPISGATIQMISAGTSGYGVAGTVLATTTTSSTGGFAFASLPDCPSNGVLVYLLSSGGNPGAGYNAFASEAAILGACGQITPSSFVNITEITTIAAAYALAPFASVSSGVTSIGSTSRNLVGLKNAVASAGVLADISSGLAQTADTFSGVIPPTAEVNTLANILSSCVNTVGSGGCATLLTAATPPGGSTPTDTFQAAIDIATNPGNNAAALFRVASASPPFQPALAIAPTDFVLGVVYKGGDLAASSAAHGVDIDAIGNAWLILVGNDTSAESGRIVEISPSGTFLSPPGGYLSASFDTPEVVAVSPSGNIEVTSFGNDQIVEMGSTGASAGPFTTANAGSLRRPVGIAIDNRDLSSWVTDSITNQLTHINKSGAEVVQNSPQSTGSTPLGVAIDGSGTVWVADSDMNSLSGSASGLSRYSPNGNGTYRTAAFSTGTGTYPFDLAIDHEGNVWSAQYSGIGKNSSDGTLLSPSGGFQSNADNSPFTLAIDGLGRVFAANSSLSHPSQPGTLTVFSNDGTLLSRSNSGYGYSANGTLPINVFGPRGIALDSSGNVWVAGDAGSPVLVELIGLAAPVLTPLSAGNSPNLLGMEP